MLDPNNTFAMATILLGLAWFGFWVDGNWLGKKTSGVVWVLIIGMLLANFELIPFRAPAYDFVGGTLMPLAIPLLLLKADFTKIFRESGRVMVAFVLASFGTIIGVLIGFNLFDLGAIGPAAAGVYSAGWIGGAVNFVAVSEALGMTADEFSITLGASSPVSMMALMTLLTLPTLSFITSRIPSKIITEASKSESEQHTFTTNIEDMPLLHSVGLLALSAAICWFANLLAAYFQMGNYAIMFITVITLIMANVMPGFFAKVRGDFTLGMLIMYLFFASIGCSTNAYVFLQSALMLFFFGVTILLIHLAFVLLCAKIFKIDLAEMIVASAAALVGSAPAAAIASARKWPTLIMPGIMCGIFGYAIATFVGLYIASVLAN